MPEHAAATTQVAGSFIHWDRALVRVPAQGQEPARQHREAGHDQDAQGLRPPTEEGPDHQRRRTPTLAPKPALHYTNTHQ